MTWQPVAHKCELAQPGDFVLLPWRAGEEIAVTNIAGEILAFDNICPHRGARIFTELRGNRPPVCAYHGRCARVGQMRLHAVSRVGGFIFASRNEVGGPECHEVMSGFFETAGTDLALHSTLAITMDCDWRDAVDNALDFEHVEHVHAQSLAKLKLSRKQLLAFTDGNSLEAFRSGDARLNAAACLFNKTHEFDYVHAHYFPTSCLSSTKGWTWSLQHYFPRLDGKTNFIHRLYVQPGGPAWFYDEVARMNAQVFREDAAICARLRPNFAATLGPSDDRIKHFRSHL